MFRVIISASLDLSDVFLIESRCYHYLKNKTRIQVLHMNEGGSDGIIEVYAKRRGYERREFSVDRRGKGYYDKKSRLPTHMEMIQHADALIAFDFGGDEIAHLVKVAREKGLLVRVVKGT